MSFWIIPSLMALAIAALLALVLMRGRSGGEPAAAYDLRVYRDQLRDIDRDLARGLISEADADRVRTEVSRRILAADAQVQREAEGNSQPRQSTLMAAALMGMVLIGGSLALYSWLGAPGYQDMALKDRKAMAQERRAERPSQAEIEAKLPPSPKPELPDDYRKLLEQLREKVAERPEDLAGNQLLARHEGASGNYTAAYTAKARAIELLGENATALDYAEQAELMVMAAGGYVSPEAEAALGQALQLDRSMGPARYFWGLMEAQTGRPDRAFRIWEETLRIGPPDAPWLPPIRAQIEEMAWRAGVEYRLPEPPATSLAGPSAADMQAAGEMSAEDRQEMIQGMVSQLAERLANEGGTAEEWARLITALGVLGDTDRAAVIYDEAQQVFAGDTAALEAVTNAARQAGVTQ